MKRAKESRLIILMHESNRRTRTRTRTPVGTKYTPQRGHRRHSCIGKSHHHSLRERVLRSAQTGLDITLDFVWRAGGGGGEYWAHTRAGGLPSPSNRSQHPPVTRTSPSTSPSHQGKKKNQPSRPKLFTTTIATHLKWWPGGAACSLRLARLGLGLPWVRSTCLSDRTVCYLYICTWSRNARDGTK